jgi:hypothetical protein
MPAAAVLLLFFAAVGAYLSRTWELVHDGPLLHYVVFLMDHGRAPYRDIIEMNMPGSYMAEWLVIHGLGGGSVAWWFADLITGLAAVLASVWIAGRQRRLAGAAAGAVIYILHLAHGPSDTGQRDWWVAILLLIGLGFLFQTVRRESPVWMTGFMVCCGLAASIKPPALAIGFFSVALVCWFFRNKVGFYRRGWPAVVGYSLLGGLFPAALVVAFLLHWGVTRDFLYDLHTLVPWYAGLGHVPVWVLLERVLVRILPALIFFVLNQSWRRWDSLLLLGFAVAGGALAILQGKGWAYHFYPEVVFAFLLAMLELERALRRSGWIRAVAGVALAIVLVALGASTWRLKSLHYPTETMEHLQADLDGLGASKLSGNIQCLDVTMGACINVLYRMQLVQSTGFIYDTYLFPEHDTELTEALQQRFLRELGTSRPKIIVLTSHAWPRGAWPVGGQNTYAMVDRFPGFEHVLASQYDLTRELPMQQEASGYRIYMRKP